MSAPPKTRRLPGHPYAGVLANKHVRRLYLGFFIASLGAGLSVVAVPWLALEIAGSVNRAFAVAAAGTAAFLPGIPVSLVAGLRRWRIPSKTVLLVDAALRVVCFGVIGGLALTHQLALGPYLLILAVSSLTRSLAAGARRTAIDELIRPEQRLAANSLLGFSIQLGIDVLGPVTGGLLVAGPGAGVTLLAYAGSSGVLYVLALTLPAAARPDREPEAAKLSLLRSVPSIVLWLMAVTFLFNLLYGPIDVGLPIFVQNSLGHGSKLYGQLFAVFGVGSLVGGLAVGALRHERVTQWVTVLSIIGWGGAALLLSVAHSPAVALIAFGFGGLLYGPFIAASVSAIQGATPPSEQGPVMALWATLTLGALPFGTLVGGPMVAGLGTRGTFALCGILTLALGVVTLGKVVTSERSKRVAPSA